MKYVRSKNDAGEDGEMEEMSVYEKVRPLGATLLSPSSDNPRNSEGSIIELQDGRLFLAYSHFYGGSADNSPAYIAGRYSEDEGMTWSERDIIVIKNEGGQNVMSVSMLRLETGEIALLYGVKNSWSDCRFYLRKSSDEAKNWSERICIMPEEGYYVVNNDRLVQLSSGRLIVPAAFHGKPFVERAKAVVFYSDDKGETWTKSKVELEAPVRSRTGLQEPGIVELSEGSLMLWARTDMDCQYISYSYDQGESWSTPEPSEMISPVSSASIKRVPTTGDLLLVYNDHSGRFPYQAGKRTPLVAAISQDDGRTWSHHKVLEDDPEGWYCYVSITFLEDKLMLSYCAGNSKIGGLNALKIAMFALNDFYRADMEG